ncbi:MAG: hypothetical protein ACYTGL_23870 [Planctomycetota bacterium]
MTISRRTALKSAGGALTLTLLESATMVSGHGREVSFLSSVLPADAAGSWETEHF